MAGAALAMLIGGTAQAADQGWAVRICRGQTEASAMKITVGDGTASKELVNWQSDNEQTNFAVPAPLGSAATLTVSIDSEPDDGKVAACVMWKGAPAKTMTFNDQLQVTAAQADSDPSCPCK
jgi:hypothetical protein